MSESSADGGACARWIDSHCHLQDRYRPEDATVGTAVDEALAAGVAGLVCIGTDRESSEQAVALAAELGASRPGGFEAWATVGLHPHEASLGVATVADVLADALRTHPGTVVAVGECGLDYHYDHSPRDAQRRVFAEQVELAASTALTLVVHARDAWDDVLDILRGTTSPPRVVFHCFTGGPDEARRCLDLGAFLSFSGIVTFKGAPEVREAAAYCPTERLLVETDAPFLAPVPHRGKDNRPAWVAVVGEAVATLRGVDAATLAASTSAATRAAFGLV